MPVPLSSPTFWRDIAAELGIVQSDRGVDFMVLDHTADMEVVVRSAEELFSTTVSARLAGMRVIVNGNYFGLTRSGYLDVGWGHDPVPAADTIVQGRVVSRGSIVAGDSQPLMFWFGQQLFPGTGGYLWTYASGAGDPPVSPAMRSALGGVGPLIIGGLNYGTGNVYRAGAPAGAPATGAPPAAAAPFLTQRNNTTFTSAESRPANTGKTILASHTGNRKLLVAVQRHGASPGMSYTAIRNTLAGLGFDHAVFLDGSDSSFMAVPGRWVSAPGGDKDEAMVVGVGFR